MDGESRAVELTVVALTEKWWPAFERLLKDGAAASRCWCMYWRIGAGYRCRSAPENRAKFRDIVAAGPPPGLLAVTPDGAAVGWCQLTLRTDLPALERDRRLSAVDDVGVRSLSCLYVRKDHRRRGVTATLIEAAINDARAAGVDALEAYPLDAAVSASTSSTGYASTFARLGFREVARRSAERPIMRLDTSVGRNR